MKLFAAGVVGAMVGAMVCAGLAVLAVLMYVAYQDHLAIQRMDGYWDQYGPLLEQMRAQQQGARGPLQPATPSR